ncbi:hypothetical protein WFJ45_24295, partial [Salmonella enterica subsp. enterica serovar Minnesota]|uniref:hypothetical protein n=1 Tax=Salmonella enterica TaxID=28901 RepID=UPI003D27A360
GNFMAWYGDWSDLDGDRSLSVSDATYAGSAASGRDCPARRFSGINPGNDPVSGEPLPPVTFPQPVDAPAGTISN